MKAMEKNVMRLVAVQHLRSAYGIKTKNWNKNKATSCKTTSNSVSMRYMYEISGCDSTPRATGRHCCPSNSNEHVPESPDGARLSAGCCCPRQSA